MIKFNNLHCDLGNISKYKNNTKSPMTYQVSWEYTIDQPKFEDVIEHSRASCGCTTEVKSKGLIPIPESNLYRGSLVGNYTPSESDTGEVEKSIWLFYKDDLPLTKPNEFGGEDYNPDKKFIKVYFKANIL